MSYRLALLLSLALPLAAWAQPLADKVPADAILYVGRYGLDDMGPGYKGSRLEAVVSTSNFPQLFDQLVPSIIQRLSRDNPPMAQTLGVIWSIAQPVARKPAALYFAGIDFQAQPLPMPRLALLSQAGNDADALLARITPLVTQAAGNVPFPIKAFKRGEIVVVSVGYTDENLVLAGGAVKSLADADSFKAALRQAHPRPCVALYLDVEATLALAEQGMKMVPDPEIQQNWPKIRDSLGLRGIKRLIWTGGFDGREWLSQAFIAAPAPRTGIMAALESKPISPAMLQSIPKTSTWAGVSHLDLAALLGNVRAIAGSINPQFQANIDQAMAAANKATGIDLQKDLLEPLGDEWAMYIDPQSAGNGLPGLVLMARPRDGARLEKSLLHLQKQLSDMAGRAMARDRMQLRFGQTQSADATVHYLAVPFLSPSWSIKNGTLYLGAYPQTVASALASASTSGNSLTENPEYQALRKRLDAPNATSILYVDLPRTAPDAYAMWLSLAQAGTGFAELFGIQTPPMVLPPLDKIRPQLSPMASVGWVDDAGWHGKAISPFPGSELLASQGGGSEIMTASILVSTLLPALNSAKERANRVKSASNLRQIGQGIMLYHNDHKKLPPDLHALLSEDALSPEVFLSPTTDKSVPRGLMADPKKAAEWVKDNSDYIYMGPTINFNDPESIMAYESPEVRPDGINILFADGHVDWYTMPAALELIEKQKAAKKPAPASRRGPGL